MAVTQLAYEYSIRQRHNNPKAFHDKIQQQFV